MPSSFRLTRLLLLAPLSLALSATAFAQGAPAGGRVSPDANHDGVIDRAEAARLPRLAARFDQLDRNRDGRLDASERPARGQRGAHHRGGLERLDRDHDGRISRAEFDAMQAARAAHARADGKARRERPDFAALDANRDGYIVRSELRAWHERMRPQREAERRARFDAKFREADLNRDGRLGRVEVSEKMPRLAERFAWLDENRDGFLSREELQPRGGRR